jgi:hypothetical protein
MDDCVWFAVDKNGDGVLLSELMLVRLDLRLAPDWYRQQMAQWPRDAIKHIEVLGLALQSYTQKHQTTHDTAK